MKMQIITLLGCAASAHLSARSHLLHTHTHVLNPLHLFPPHDHPLKALLRREAVHRRAAKARSSPAPVRAHGLVQRPKQQSHALTFPAGNVFLGTPPHFSLPRKERLSIGRTCILQLLEKKRWMDLGTLFFYIAFWHVAGLELFVSNLL